MEAGPQMSQVDNLLSHLDKVKPTAKGCFIARCPAHEDKSPSLTIRELDDGRVLLHCFGGCSVHEVLDAVGLDMAALFPPREIQHGKPERRPFPAADVLRAIGFESLVVCAAAVTMMSGEAFTQVDRDRLILATERIQAGLTAAGVQRG
jgi:hypothetical protein